MATNRKGIAADSAGGPPATVRSVAREAGVSPMTVSRVLNGHSHVRSELRLRVLEAVRNQGYHSDLELQKLMARLRQRRVQRMQGSICALTCRDWQKDVRSYYYNAVCGARRRAEALHLGWDACELREILLRPDRAVRVLRSRGVEGILVLPHTGFPVLPHGAIWDGFSVVAVTANRGDPEFHRVLPDDFRNMQRICEALSARGCRRIGLAISKSLDRRNEYRSSGGFLAFHLEHNRPLLSFPLYGEEESGDRLGRLCDWFHTERPDAMIADDSAMARTIADALDLPLPGPVAFAAIPGLEVSDSPVATVDELPGQVGATAVERLFRMIVNGETGTPEHPTVTMIEGVWREEREAERLKS